MSKCIKIKGGMIAVTTIHIQIANPQKIKEELAEFSAQAPSLVQGMPVVLDFGELETPQDIFAAIVDASREVGVNPFAVKGKSHLRDISKVCKLSYLTDTRKSQSFEIKQEDESVSIQTNEKPVIQVEIKEAAKVEDLVITTPVRSGQQIYARGANLIVRANVSRGAEILADGHIHVYGALRGRAMAGLQGNDKAFIFCKEMDAELLVINGDYLPQDSIPQDKINQSVCIYKEDNKILIENN